MTQTSRLKGGVAATMRLFSAACLAWAASATTSSVLAQESADEDVSPNVSVSERFGRNFGVDGIRSGSFVLFPVARYTQTYVDNVFSVPTNKTDDLVGDIFAELSLRSDWDVHDFNLTGNVRRLQFFDNTDESTTDYGVGGDGRFDLGRRSFLSFSADYSRQTEARRALQTVNGTEPVRFPYSEHRLF